MSDSYIIEVDSEDVGIVVRDGDGFCFFAASRAFYALDGRYFSNVRDAERAARRHGEPPPRHASAARGRLAAHG